MASRPGQKIKMTSIDELLCVPDMESTVELDVRSIYPFEKHPFKVIDDEKMDELILADEKTGKPIGSGLGDIFDHKILILKGYKFPKKGTYQIKIQQFMRQNPLPDVLSFGLAIEKAE